MARNRHHTILVQQRITILDLKTKLTQARHKESVLLFTLEYQDMVLHTRASRQKSVRRHTKHIIGRNSNQVVRSIRNFGIKKHISFEVCFFYVFETFTNMSKKADVYCAQHNIDSGAIKHYKIYNN